MGEFKHLSIMMGAVTETETLRETVYKLLNICNTEDIKEIIISYADRTTPETHAVIQELLNLETTVPIVAFKQTRPFMGCIKDMIDFASGSHCILVASDMALDLEPVAELIRKAKVDPETIHSLSRWKKGCRFDGYGKVRYALNFLAQKFIAVLYMKNLTDFTIPVQIAPSPLYKSISFEETGFPLLLEMVLKPLRLGYKFTEIPTNCYSRKEGKTSNSTLETFSYLRVALHIRFMRKKNILFSEQE